MKAKKIIGAVFVFVIALSPACKFQETPGEGQDPGKNAPAVKIQPPVHLVVHPGPGPKSADGIPYVVTVMPRQDVDEAVLRWNLPEGAKMAEGYVREQVPANGLRRNSKTTYNVVIVPGADNQSATVSVKVRIGSQWYGTAEEVDLSVPGGKAKKPKGKGKKPRTEFPMKRVY